MTVTSWIRRILGITPKGRLHLYFTFRTPSGMELKVSSFACSSDSLDVASALQALASRVQRGVPQGSKYVAFGFEPSAVVRSRKRRV